MKTLVNSVASVAVVVAFLLIGGLVYTVDQTEQVIITQFGKPVDEPITEPGLHFKIPLIQAVNRLDKRFLEWDGAPVGIRGVAIDVTARKRNEEALQLATHKLGLLSSITRHDVLNSSSAALGYLELARRGTDDPAVVELVQKAAAQTRRIQAEMEVTRKFQALGSQRPAWIPLAAVMPGDQVPPTIAFHVDVAGIAVCADPMLAQVFSNLLDNSVRYGETVTEVRVSGKLDDGVLTVVWEDDGVGIAVAEKERIFEQGYGRNTGLGLFLAREILALTGITIQETGEPSRSTTKAS